MSKYVKNLISDDLRKRLDGVTDMLLVNVIGMDANQNNVLRRQLREKNIRLMVVKNSLARRATEGTPLSTAFEGLEGTLAVLWAGDPDQDIVTLAKEVARFSQDDKFAPFGPRGGLMDGARMTSDQVREVSKWPTRDEQISLLVGQILSPGARLSSQLLSSGAKLASQIEQKGGDADEA